MTQASDPRNPGLKAGDRIGGYLLKRVVELTEIEAVFYELEHEKTGARHAHVSRKDKENTFGVAFKTVPRDSSGVAHILEHTALCGSRKYPVRDPFFSMLKRSLSTFMNAFTASDWTMYPFSTQNRTDYYNLMDIYLDAAFFPKLDELSFKQEGHRLEIDDTSDGDQKLEYKGVVYNEMKGAMSSPDQVMGRSLLNALFPDTTYSFNSGGEPSDIPKLTHGQLKQFHQRHYHPSNAYFYTYGDLPLKDHLAFIEERALAEFDKIDLDTEVESQPRWDKPRTATYYYPIAKNEDLSKKSQVAVAWLQADILDTYEVLALAILEQVLIGNSASPLRKALIDSGLGTALADSSGYGADTRDTMFSIGLKGVELEAAEKIEKIVLDVLEEQAKSGIDPELVESAIHQIEFHRKEVTNTPFPYGIKLMMAFGGPWFHGVDPVDILLFDEDLEKMKKEIADGPFLEGKVRQYFLDNPHRVLFKLAPDQSKEEKENRRVEEELDKIMGGLSADDIEKIKQDAKALQKLQETPEDLSVLPTLELSEIPPEVVKIQETEITESAWLYRQPTSGIFYFSSATGVGDLDENLTPLVPFFCYALPKSGTKLRNYEQIARRIDLYTGGVSLSAQARTGYADLGARGPGVCVPFVTFGGKCLVRNIEKLFEILKEFYTEYSFSDLPRLKNLLLEYRAGMESSIVQNGHRYAISLSSRNLSLASALSEIWHGIHQVRFLKELTNDLNDQRLQTIADDLSAIAKSIFTQDNVRIALVGEEGPLAEGDKLASDLHESLADDIGSGFGEPEMELADAAAQEAWTTSTAVSFAARTFQTVRFGHPDAPAMSVIAKMMRSLFLHREIREKGGAYGGFSIYSPEDGQFCLASYRDPHVVGTLDAFQKAFDFIRSGDYTDDDVKEAILQVCSEIDKPDPPGVSARKSFYRKILQLTDESRDKHKKDLLALDRERIVEVAGKYFDPDAAGHSVAVITGEEKLKHANEKLGKRSLAVFSI